MYAYSRFGLKLAHPSMRGTVYRTSDPRALRLMEKPVTTAATTSHVSTTAAAIRQEYKLHQHHVHPALKETDWKAGITYNA
jgi:hypothetical protein